MFDLGIFQIILLAELRGKLLLEVNPREASNELKLR